MVIRKDGLVLYYFVFDGVKLVVGWLVEWVGFGKGYLDVGVVLCWFFIKYVLVLINCGGVIVEDVVMLVCVVCDGVYDVFGIILKFEFVLIGCML